jgi:hypothetical protein
VIITTLYIETTVTFSLHFGDKMALKGFITFFINFVPGVEQDVKQTLDLAANYNKDVIEKLRAADYEVMFVATTKEACRVEKIDLDKPHPRFVANNVPVDDSDSED